jgi:murein L,D-transpeptidase YcbB/YkuD
MERRVGNRPEGIVKLSSRVWLLLAVLSGLPQASVAGQDSSAPDVRTLIATARLPWSRWPDFSRYVDDVARIYMARADAPVWLGESGLSRQGREALAQLAAAGGHGLDPRDYDVPTLDSLMPRLDGVPGGAAERMRFDLLLSVAFVRFIADLREGRTHPARLSRSLAPAPLDLAAAVSAAIAGDSVPRLAAAVSPPFAQYRNLRQELARYRGLVSDSTLAPVPPVPRLRPGDAYGGVDALRRRLSASGDFPADTFRFPKEQRYAGDLVEAVRRFQRRHALSADGVVGPRTFAALNAPLAGRVRQIELALERLRWLPPVGRQSFVVVNIPAFRLFAFDSAGGMGRPSLGMRVIVGKALDTRTPVLVEQLRYLEFRPYWNVPRSILAGEILPQLRRRPDYLRVHGMELVGPRDRVLGDSVTPAVLAQLARGELRVRQRPSRRNPLGQVKFVFPNAADVYLHGTPDTTLFAETRRDFSHGCIRLEDPAALATWVLRDQQAWPADSVRAAMAGKVTRRALLTRPMPVILFYTTAVAWPEGGVMFYPDLYGHDRELDEALRAGPTPP